MGQKRDPDETLLVARHLVGVAPAGVGGCPAGSASCRRSLHAEVRELPEFALLMDQERGADPEGKAAFPARPITRRSVKSSPVEAIEPRGGAVALAG